MYRHGPVCLEGPVTRARRCWRDSSLTACEAENESPEIRAELVARIRREIAEGTYDTPEKWDAALARLLRRLEES